MKHLLAPILLLTLLFPSLAYGLEFKDLVERDGIYYEKFTDVPFTGEVKGISQGAFKDGKKNGSWIIYYDNGQLLSKGEFLFGMKEGLWTYYYSDGKLWQTEFVKNGKGHGLVVTYHRNGQIKNKGNMLNDQREGLWVFYNEDGKKRITPRVQDGFTFDEGSGTYKNGKKISD